ncbi:MAG: TIGR03960 family B12-binding radical SAM protein [Desulfamplus sp.]|nr:TIGR03960 family B12-binding radical SAM protein [Desulfamplus sp.]
MNKINIQEILRFVEMPSRYLGCEANTIKKDLSKVDLKFALAFPDLYEIGTSHFGMQILYTILNKQQNIAAERFFTPALDMEKILKEKKLPLFSLESEIDMKSFDIVGFSLLYELNFTNILTMLDLAGIPFYSAQRDSSLDSFPLIIAGGPCAFNPEPLADFFDAFLIGDGEQAVIDISEVFIQWKKDIGRNRKTCENNCENTKIASQNRADSGENIYLESRTASDLKENLFLESTTALENKKELLRRLSKIEGVYVPSFFKATWNEKGIQHLEPLEQGYERVKRAILPDLSSAPFPTSPVVPFGKPVHDRLRLEIARGCSRGCRFCQAGMIYRPVRERSVNDLVEIASRALQQTGYSDLSLLSLSTGDYSNLANLMEELMGINPGHCISISLPSVRAGKLTAPLMKIIKRVKKTGFTIAPEAGTQRLRDVINKNITQEDIFKTVSSAFELGWRNIKLYFMNGLPTETPEDVAAIADMAKELASIKIRKGKSTIGISFATFIPKAHTPFERCSQIDPDQAFENLNFLKQNLRHPGINLKWQNPKMSLLEGVWARGDRKLSEVLVKAWVKGCRLDGWSDMFRFDLWKDAFDECGIDPYFYTVRQREEDEILPWSHIDCGISDKFMKNEFKKAIAGELTHDCREHGCTGCGICDFERVQPVLHESVADHDSKSLSIEIASRDAGLLSDAEPLNNRVGNNTLPQSDSLESCIPDDKLPSDVKLPISDAKKVNTENSFSKLTIFYSRLGKARHFGHLELAKIIRRAIRRTGLKVRYSTGFSPAMKISFDNPLPVGMESEEEFFSIHADLSQGYDIKSSIKPDDIVAKLNAVLPSSITITRCIPSSAIKKKNNDTVLTSYRIDLKTFSISQQTIDEFMALSEYVVEKLNFKGVQRSIDLRRVTKQITLLSSAERVQPESAITLLSSTESTQPESVINGRSKSIDHSAQLEITLQNDGQRTIRPAEILTEAFNVPDEVLHAADTLKLKQDKLIKQVKNVC